MPNVYLFEEVQQAARLYPRQVVHGIQVRVDSQVRPVRFTAGKTTGVFGMASTGCGRYIARYGRLTRPSVFLRVLSHLPHPLLYMQCQWLRIVRRNCPGKLNEEAARTVKRDAIVKFNTTSLDRSINLKIVCTHRTLLWGRHKVPRWLPKSLR